MLSLIIASKKVIDSFIVIWKKEETRALLFMISITLLSGTIFYSTVEKFSVIDSLYFSFMTLTTIGYGNYAPATTLGKIFTMIYVMVGLGLMSMFITTVAKSYIYNKKHHSHHHHKKHDEKESNIDKSNEEKIIDNKAS